MKKARLTTSTLRKTEITSLIALLLLFFLINLAYLSINMEIDYDEAVYSQIANSILGGKAPYTDFSLFKTYLHPYILSFVFLVGGAGFNQIRVASVIFEALTIVGIYLIGKELQAESLGLIAAAMYAINYFSVFMNNAGKTETLFNAFMIFSIYFLIKWQQQRTKKNLSVSSLLLSLAFLTLPRGAAFALAAFLAALVVIKEWKNAIVFLTFFVVTSTLLCTPFLLVSPRNFVLEVFLFNMVRVQLTPGLASSVEWLTLHGNLTLITLGTIGTLAYVYPFAKKSFKTKNLKLSESVEPFFSCLLASLCVFFFVVLILPGFVYPYMFYPLWPVLSFGSAIIFHHIFAFLQNGSLRLFSKSGIRLMLTFSLVGLLVATVFFDGYSTISTAGLGLSESNVEYHRLKEVADFIEAHTEPSERILSTIPSLAFRVNRDFVLPPRPYGGTLDLINYLHFKAFITIYENYTLNNILSDLPLARSIINEVQESIEEREIFNLLIQARIVVLATNFWEYHVPGYNDVIRPTIVTNCKLIGTFETLHYGLIEVYITHF